MSIRFTKYYLPYNAFVSLKCKIAASFELSKFLLTFTGGDHLRLGFMLQIRGIEPLTYKKLATLIDPFG